MNGIWNADVREALAELRSAVFDDQVPEYVQRAINDLDNADVFAEVDGS